MPLQSLQSDVRCLAAEVTDLKKERAVKAAAHTKVVKDLELAKLSHRVSTPPPPPFPDVFRGPACNQHSVFFSGRDTAILIIHLAW